MLLKHHQDFSMPGPTIYNLAISKSCFFKHRQRVMVGVHNHINQSSLHNIEHPQKPPYLRRFPWGISTGPGVPEFRAQEFVVVGELRSLKWLRYSQGEDHQGSAKNCGLSSAFLGDPLLGDPLLGCGSTIIINYPYNCGSLWIILCLATWNTTHAFLLVVAHDIVG